MRRLLPVALLVLSACVAEPPERSPLPDLADVLPVPAGCRLNVGVPLGVNVESVISGTPAAGIMEEGDLITSIDGEKTPDRPTLSQIMASRGPGETIEIGYIRDNAPSTSLVTLGTSSADPERGVIGITVQTAFEQIGPEEADDTIEPSPTVRAIEVGGLLYLLDPLTHSWQETGITPPAETRWATTSTAVYTVTDTEPHTVLDLFTDAAVADDGFEDWEAQRLVGVVGDTLLLVVTTEIPEQPGFVNIALAGFDPLSGETAWVTPVPAGFGIPVAAHGSPDGTEFVVVGADPESGERVGVTLYDSDGNVQSSEGLSDLGEPMGWFDDTSLAFRTNESTISVFDFARGSAETFGLPDSLAGSVSASVGDGRHILVVGGRDLLIQDLTDTNYSVPLADNCTIGRTGDPGWGV